MAEQLNQLKTILTHTVSSDQNALKEASRLLEEYSNNNFVEFVGSLSQLLADQSCEAHVRQAAGIQLKNGLVAKNASVKTIYQQRWIAIPEEARNKIKQNVYCTLGTETSKPSSAAQCISAIASAELPVNLWPDLMQNLVTLSQDPNSSPQCKEATLETIGYICQDLDANLLENYAQLILRAIVTHMGDEQVNVDIRATATNAFLNSLEFIRGNFSKDDDRNFIMTVVCQATQCADNRVKVTALQCLVKIIQLYYEFMENYMKSALFAITIQAMRDQDEDVKLQGVEFWSTVCDEEIDLAIELAEANESGADQTDMKYSRFYAKGALEHIIPILLEILKDQDESDDEDDWTPHKASGVCIMLLASCVGNEIIQHVIPFVQENITGNWQQKDAAVMAFGAMLEGPDVEQVQHYVERGMPKLLELMADESMIVRDSVAWTLSRVCDQVPHAALNPTYLNNLLDKLIANLGSLPRVATNVCWAISSLSDAANESAEPASPDDDEPQTFCLSEKFGIIVEQIIACGDRPDANQHNLRSSAYECLMELIKNSPKDVYQVVQLIHNKVLSMMNQILQSAHSFSDQSQANDFKSLLCATLQASLRKLNKDDAEATSEACMAILVQLLQASKTGGVQEDALMAIGTLIECTGAQFNRFVPALAPLLEKGLQSTAEPQVCISAIGVVGDLSRAISKEIVHIATPIMSCFVTTVADQAVDRSIKPHILSAFGDIALAIGTDFKMYAEPVLATLYQASNAEVDKSDYDMIDFLNELRDACLEAYTGIIQGLKGDDDKNVCPEVQLVAPHLEHIINFIQTVGADDDRTDSLIGASCGLLGDLCAAFGADAALKVDTTPFQDLLQEGRRSKNSKTKTLAVWASKTIRNLRNKP